MNKRNRKIFFVFGLLLVFIGSNNLYGQDNKVIGAEDKKPSKEGSRPSNEPNTTSNSPNEPSSPEEIAIIEEIKAQLATMATKQLKELRAFCEKNDILGDFVVDLTVEGKGKVVTVFMVSGGEGNIPKKNLLKNKLSQLQFDNIKIPKKQRVKSRYILKF